MELELKDWFLAQRKENICIDNDALCLSFAKFFNKLLNEYLLFWFNFNFLFLNLIKNFIIINRLMSGL